jgi:hypothetical protein
VVEQLKVLALLVKVNHLNLLQVIFLSLVAEAAEAVNVEAEAEQQLNNNIQALTLFQAHH